MTEHSFLQDVIVLVSDKDMEQTGDRRMSASRGAGCARVHL